MKSLKESLFDDDLVSKEQDIEYLYGLINRVSIISYAYIDYLDFKKIQKDFNRLPKQFEMQDWSNIKYNSMKNIRGGETEEALRQLTYIIAANIKSVNLISRRKISDEVINCIHPYLSKNYSTSILVNDYNVLHTGKRIIIEFFYHPYSKKCLGDIVIDYNPL